MPDDHALVLDRRGGALRVGPIPTADPGERQIAVRARAVAINPVDRYIQPVGRFIVPWLRHPAVLGSDVAGEVVAIGSGASRFRIGQRVLGLALGTDKGRGAAEGAFRHRVLLDERLVSPIPDGMEFADAAVLPLGLSTAASGLFQSDHLGLRPPTGGASTGEAVLVWGASTSVGSNAVQLAALAGYEVVATASPRNHGYVSGLGAGTVFDYRDPATPAAIAAALGKRRVAGAMAIGDGSLERCIAVLRRCEGRRFIAVATSSVSFEHLLAGGTGPRRLLLFLLRMGVANARDALAARRAGISTRFIWGSSLKDDAVGPMIFEDFLPRALADRRYRAAPPARVVGHGLDAIPAALAEQNRGVSACKIVVTL